MHWRNFKPRFKSKQIHGCTPEPKKATWTRFKSNIVFSMTLQNWFLTKKIVNVLQDVMILHKRCSLSGKDNHLLKNHFYKLHKVLKWDLLVSEKNNSDLNYQNSFLKRFSLNSKLTEVFPVFLGKVFSSFLRHRRLFLFFRWSHIRCYKVHTIS